jgi:beta-galactosidase
MPRAMIDHLEQRRLLAFVPPVDPRVVTNLDAGWKFLRADAANPQTAAFDDSTWSAVNVPHTWNNADGQDGVNNYYRGIGWYRKHLTPAAALAGKSLYLKFDGANLTTDLYVNGVIVGEHKGGYSAFGWDVSPYLTVGVDNVIAVKVNNANDNNVPPLAGDYTMFGGIYRHVNLIATNPQHVALAEFVPPDSSGIGPSAGYWLNTPGVYLKTTNVSSASAGLAVTTDLRNDAAIDKTLTVVADVVDAAGNLVTELSGSQFVAAGANANLVQTTTINSPHLWDGVADPFLYTVYVSVLDGATVSDALQQPLGFRSFSIDPNQGAILNGHYYDLHGINFHQDRLNKGWAISDADQVEDVNLIRDIGATFVRLSHYQHPTLTYDLLDQDGIAAWSEIPINGTSGTGVTNTTAFLDNAKQQLQETMRQNYNHPAVLVWGLWNEINDTTINRSAVTALNNLAHQEDPTRPTTAATNQSATGPLNAIPDAIAFNEYLGWYGGTYDQIAGWIDSTHASIPNRPIGIGEYGAGAAITQHQDNPPPPDPSGLWHPEEYQNQFHEAYWIAMKSRPFVWEKTVWNMFDFAADGRNEGDTPGRNDKGLVTYDRQTRKDAFYFYKANWSADPVLYITSRRFTSRQANTIPIKIYANMDSVTLKVNGVTIGTLSSAAAPDKIFLWNNIAVQAGTNLIEVSGTRGGQTYTDSVSFTNTPPLAQIPAMTGTPFARINFQPSTSTAIGAYSSDNGLVYGVRGDGKSYGWNVDNSANARERTTGFLATPPDSRYTRFVHMQRNGTFTWELAVPNGTYDVHLVAGDSSFIDSTHVIDLEGRIALQGVPTTSAPWIESTVRVTITDGRLTVSADVSGKNDKIAYIDVNTAAFAHLEGSTLNLDFDGSANPINLASDGSSIMATRNGTTYSFPSASLAGIVAHATTAADHLIVNSDIAQPVSFLGGSTGDDSIAVNAGASLLLQQCQRLHTLSIADGSVNFAAGGNRTLLVDMLTIDPAGRLDVSDNALVVTAGDVGSWDGSAYTGITGYIATGRGGGSWNGSGGIVTSAPTPGSNYTTLAVARASEILGIGPADAGVWRGQTVTGSNTLVIYTYGGDANLDGKINVDDYGKIDFNVTLPGVSGWYNGDFNYDGKINVDDYGIIDFNVGIQGPPLGSASALARSFPPRIRL